MSRWEQVCSLSELKEGKGHEVWVNGRPLALFLHQDSVHALEDRCPHREGQMSRGQVVDGDAVCPLHGWNFDLATGISPYNPHDRLDIYPVRITDGAVEIDAEAVPALPPATFDGYQGRWRRWSQDTRGKQEVRKLASGKPPAVGAMGAEPPVPGAVPGFEHFQLRAAQLARLPKQEDELVSTTVVLGRGAGKPLQLDLPLFISHMSFGAISREAKIALARGSAVAGSMTCSGEGGMLADERAAARLYVLEMASGYFGWSMESMSQADAFEIKLGQSAKPGMGGELPAAKVTEEIAHVRGIEADKPAHSPARFPDLSDVADFAERVASLRSHFPEKPIGIKLAANHLRQDLEVALSLQPDYITVDGFGGGTGSAPTAVRDHFGMPLVMALPLARRRIDIHNASARRPVSLVATGGVRTPSDVIKALALGADACAVATAALFAVGCEYYRACNSGNCPTGIATQSAELRARLDPEVGAERVANYLNGTRQQLEQYLRIMGHTHLRDLSAEDLLPLTPQAGVLLRDE